VTVPAYTSAEDSALLRRVLRSRSGGCLLEVGAGNGGALVDASRRHDLVVGTDILRPAMDDWKGAGSNYVLADRASCFRASSFDVVAFNPPYVPMDAGEDPAVGGGARLEVPKAFLVEAFRVVKRGGEVIFLLNDQADTKEFEKMCSEEGFTIRREASERAFFEELGVYSAKSSGQGLQAGSPR